MTAEQYAQRAFDLNLLDAREMASVWGYFGTREVPADEFLKTLVRREILTNFQLDKLVRGEKTGFFYGDYKVLYLVGTGTFARVYRAVHKGSGKVVALKVLRKRFSEEPMQLARFLREGEMGTKLRHPNIVPIFEVHSIRRDHFLVMAFVEGQSLREFVKLRGKVESLEATQIMAGIMSGLVYAGERGITHRDLKLSNVLISSDGRPQLVDFGLAGGADAESGTANARTVDYAGLEKLTGVSKDDPRSDIYFAGCMYYHLLTGVAPLSETRDKIARASVSRFREVMPIRQREAEIPSVVEMIVEKSMNLTVSERYARPVEMGVDLQRAINALEAAAKQGDPSGSSLSLGGDRSVCVLLLESQENVQIALRKVLKKAGYNVLVMEDPERASKRVMSAPESIGCMIVSTGSLGRSALKFYQEVRSFPRTGTIPTVLLLGRSHGALQAKLGLPKGVHRAVTMPLKAADLVNEVRDVFVPAPAKSA